MTQEVGRDGARAENRTMFKRSVQDVTPEVDRDRARVGNPTRCATGSEQDMTPEVNRIGSDSGSVSGEG